jgi:hypothetical protein
MPIRLADRRGSNFWRNAMTDDIGDLDEIGKVLMTTKISPMRYWKL